MPMGNAMGKCKGKCGGPSWWVCNGFRAGMRCNTTEWQTMDMSVIKDLSNAVGGKTKSAEPLSEVRQKVLVLGSDFRKQGEGKIAYYST